MQVTHHGSAQVFAARVHILRRKSLWEAEDWRQHFAWERASAGVFSPAVDSFHSIVAFSRVTFHWSTHGFSGALILLAPTSCPGALHLQIFLGVVGSQPLPYLFYLLDFIDGIAVWKWFCLNVGVLLEKILPCLPHMHFPIQCNSIQCISQFNAIRVNAIQFNSIHPVNYTLPLLQLFGFSPPQ